MKILVIGKFYIEGFALHIAETLSGMGHAVSRFEPGIRGCSGMGAFGYRVDQVRGAIYSATDGVPSIRARRIKSLWREVEAVPPEVVIVCHDFLWPAEVDELKRRSRAKVAMWFPDAMINFGRGFFMTAAYDALFFKDPYIVKILGGVLKSPVYYLPECFNPEQHWLPEEKIGNNSDYSCDVCMVGNQHSWRVAFCNNLQGYNLKLWGNPAPLWMKTGVASSYQGRGVYKHEKVLAFRGAKIVLNNLHFSEIWGLNARAFEVAGAGAFQIVDWRSGLNQLFEDGRELITYTGMNDLRKKIDYWLPRDAERRAIAMAGMSRAHAEHTYVLRLELLLKTLAGAKQGYLMQDIG